MDKIPTADEILIKHNGNDSWTTNEDAKSAMIEFAKFHVNAAIKECIESAPSGSSTDTVSYEDVVESLKDCYPETNII